MSVAGIPYDTTDPFIVRQLPDVYVVGNQAALEVERRVIGGKEVVLIALPAFSATGEAALVNLETLEVEPIRFEVEGAEKKEMEVEEKEWLVKAPKPLTTIAKQKILRLVLTVVIPDLRKCGR